MITKAESAEIGEECTEDQDMTEDMKKKMNKNFKIVCNGGVAGKMNKMSSCSLVIEKNGECEINGVIGAYKEG